MAIANRPTHKGSGYSKSSSNCCYAPFKRGEDGQECPSYDRHDRQNGNGSVDVCVKARKSRLT